MAQLHDLLTLPLHIDAVAEALTAVLRDQELVRQRAADRPGNWRRAVESVTFHGATTLTTFAAEKRQVCDAFVIYRIERGFFDFAMERPSPSKQVELSEEGSLAETSYFRSGDHLGICGAFGEPLVTHEFSGDAAIFTIAFRHHKIVDRTITYDLHPPRDVYLLEVQIPSTVDVAYREGGP